MSDIFNTTNSYDDYFRDLAEDPYDNGNDDLDWLYGQVQKQYGEPASKKELQKTKDRASNFHVISPSSFKELTLQPGQRAFFIVDDMLVCFKNESAFPSIIKVDMPKEHKRLSSFDLKTMFCTPIKPWYEKEQARPFTISMTDHTGKETAHVEKRAPVGLERMGTMQSNGCVAQIQLNKQQTKRLKIPIAELENLGGQHGTLNLSTMNLKTKGNVHDFNDYLNAIDAVKKEATSTTTLKPRLSHLLNPNIS